MLNISYVTPSTTLLLSSVIIPSPLSGRDSWIFIPTTSSDLSFSYQSELTSIIIHETNSLNTILATIASDKQKANEDLEKAKKGSTVYKELETRIYELTL